MVIGIDAHSLEGKRTGVGRVLFNILKEWEKSQGVRFILYFKDWIPDDIPEIFEKKLLKTGSTAKFIHWNLWRAVKRDKIDVLFCPEYIGPILYGGKMAVLLHDISYEAHPESFNWKSPADKILLRWVSRKTAQKKNAILLVPVNFVKDEVIKHYKIPVQRMTVTGEGVDSNLIAKSEDKTAAKLAAVKEKFGIKDKFVFYVGSIFSRRHLPEIISAFEKLAAKNPGFQFLVAGKDYTHVQTVDKMAGDLNRKLGYEAIIRVDFADDDDLKLLYSACAFFIWLSDYEGFGLPPLEAMANGAPVITTNGTSLAEVAGNAALLVNNNENIEEIAAAMEKINQDEALRRSLIERGYERAKKYSWKDCAENILKALIKS